MLMLGVWLFPNFTKPIPIQADEMIKIPAGEFIFSRSTKVNLPDFWIDKYEVTIAAYAEFLAGVPKAPSKYDHPDQPRSKSSHMPINWSDYYPSAVENATYKGFPISLNTPVLWADWWDAYAYAKWRGHRLPTEQEWEKAARGTAGSLYPWSNAPNPAFANTGEDFSSTASSGGAIDGFGSWSNVDAKTEDKSIYGVCGLAGNVAEWTSTWSQHPDLPDQQSPIYRGGAFHQKDAPLADQRWTAKSPNLAQPFIGFRTVSDHPSTP